MEDTFGHMYYTLECFSFEELAERGHVGGMQGWRGPFLGRGVCNCRVERRPPLYNIAIAFSWQI